MSGYVDNSLPDKMALLGSFLVSITKSVTEREIYSSLANHLPSLLSCERCSVTLFNQEMNQLEIFALHGSEGRLPIGKFLPIENSQVGLSYLQNKTLFSEIPKDLENVDFIDLKMLNSQGLNYCINTPINLRGATVGTLNIASESMDCCNDWVVQMMSMVSSLVSTYLDRAMLQDESRKLAETYRLYSTKLEIVNKAATKLSLVEESEEIFKIVHYYVEKIIPVSALVYAEKDPRQQCFEIIFSSQKMKEINKNIAQDWFKGIENKNTVVFYQKITVDNIEHLSLNHLSSEPSGWGIPISIDGRCIGVLMVISEHNVIHNSKISQVLQILGDMMGSTLIRINMQYQLQHQANHDRLTGLPNRYQLENLLNVTFKGEYGVPVALMFIDLDHFKGINDSLGHAAGDQLLCISAKRIQHIIKNTDVIARFGGDEFAVILTDWNDIRYIKDVADRILIELKKPFVINGSEVFIGASIGISFYPQDAQNRDDFLRQADLAMYYAKSSGRNNYQFYSQEMSDKSNYQQLLTHALYNAQINNQFYLEFQPIFSENKMIGVEALIRWKHPTLGLISPEDFIHLAEKNGLIKELTAWVIDESFNSLQKLHVLYPNLYLSINVSAQDCLEPELLFNTLVSALDRYQLSGSLIEIEITESVYLEDKIAIHKLIELLSRYNIRVAIDDFGTGYSSLTYLLDLPLNTFKIDRSFINNIDQDSLKKGVMTGILHISESLDMRCVAEGIETQAQLDCLMTLGFDRFQGFLFSKPLSLSSLMEKNISLSWSKFIQT